MGPLESRPLRLADILRIHDATSVPVENSPVAQVHFEGRRCSSSILRKEHPDQASSSPPPRGRQLRMSPNRRRSRSAKQKDTESRSPHCAREAQRRCGRAETPARLQQGARSAMESRTGAQLRDLGPASSRLEAEVDDREGLARRVEWIEMR